MHEWEARRPLPEETDFSTLSISYTAVSEEQLEAEQAETVADALPEPDAALQAEIETALQFHYADTAAKQLSLLSVSSLTHDKTQTEPEQEISWARPRFLQQEALTATERGTATHTFLQYVSFSEAEKDPKAALQTLVQNGHLTEAEADSIRLLDIRHFFQSELYQRVRRSPLILREKKFLVQLDLLLPKMQGEEWDTLKQQHNPESMIKGIIDLAFWEQNGFVLVDYKNRHDTRYDGVGESLSDAAAIVSAGIRGNHGRTGAAVLLVLNLYRSGCITLKENCMEQSLTNMRYVRTLLERHGFHFSKKLGQNFLINPDVCPRIAEMGNAKPEHGILEIGTGIGTLTAELAKRAEKVTAVEVDARLFPILEETVGQYENLHIIHQDILKCDIPALLEQEFGTMPVSVCANLPYYITAPILMHLLESRAKLETITVMVQKEVAEKLTAPVGTREAGAITVAVQYYGTVTQLFSVSRGSFLPPPNVDSAVIQIQLGTPYAEQVADEKHFFRMVRSGFSQRRKTLVNALSATMGYEKAVVSKALIDCGLSETVRMESLSMEQLIALHRALLEA